MNTFTAGTTIYYKMRDGQRIYKQTVKDVSPSGRCILVADDGGKRDIWLDADTLELLDSETPKS